MKAELPVSAQVKAEVPAVAEQTTADQTPATDTIDRAAAVTTAATLVGRADVTITKVAPAASKIDPSAGVGAEPVPVGPPTGTVVPEPKKAPEPARGGHAGARRRAAGRARPGDARADPGPRAGPGGGLDRHHGVGARARSRSPPGR